MQVPGRISLGVVAWAAIAASQAGCGNSGDAQKHAKPTATAVASNLRFPIRSRRSEMERLPWQMSALGWATSWTSST